MPKASRVRNAALGPEERTTRALKPERPVPRHTGARDPGPKDEEVRKMRESKLTSALTLCCAVFAGAVSAGEKPHNWERGRVVDQQLSSSRVGAYAAPIGTGVVAVPLYQRSNVVTVETDAYSYRWIETRNRRPIILPVNGDISFYRDRDWFVVIDTSGRKHKFGLLGQTVKPPRSADTATAPAAKGQPANPAPAAPVKAPPPPDAPDADADAVRLPASDRK